MLNTYYKESTLDWALDTMTVGSADWQNGLLRDEDLELRSAALEKSLDFLHLSPCPWGCAKASRGAEGEAGQKWWWSPTASSLWSNIPIFPETGRLGQEKHKFEVRLGYTDPVKREIEWRGERKRGQGWKWEEKTGEERSQCLRKMDIFRHHHVKQNKSLRVKYIMFLSGTNSSSSIHEQKTQTDLNLRSHP